MELNKLTELAYSIYMHKINKTYDATKYNFGVSGKLSKQLTIFYNQNKFNLQHLTIYDETQTKLRLIISYFINNSQLVTNCSDSDYEKMITQLTEYANEFTLFFEKVLKDNIELTPMVLMKMFNKKEIPFYIFYYMLKYGGFKSSQLETELLKNRFVQTYKLMLFFKHFDENYIQTIVERLMRYLELNRVGE